MFLAEKSVFTITTEPVAGTEEIASTTYPRVRPRCETRATRSCWPMARSSFGCYRHDGVAAHCEVVAGGTISDRKGINLPGVNVSTPSLSKKDVADAHFRR